MDSLLAIDVTRWQDEETLIGLMKDIWRRHLLDSGMDEMGVASIVDSSDETSVLWMVESLLTSAEEDLQTRQMPEAGQATAGEASSAAPAAAAPEESETATGAIAEGSTEQEVAQ
jgi:hypothetical protein